MGWDHGRFIEWLLTTGRRRADLNDLMRDLGPELVASGAPVWRVRLAMRTVHPLIAAQSAVWERDSGALPPQQSTHGLEQRPAYQGSPLAQISETGEPFRCDLTALTPDAHLSLREMRDRGATDYYGLPLRFSGDGGANLVFVTDCDGGFDAKDIAAFEMVAEALAPLVEIWRLRGLAAAVAETYLGPRTGRRVLGGQITRGDIETMQAAILISDIRGWTALNAQHGPAQTIALANRYFEIMAAAVETHGGEILKLLGDGILAIFPADHGGAAACRHALAAARDAVGSAAVAEPAIGADFGIGLHFGEVAYGNVGSADRLDFTVLGQAVNIAARIEPLCATYGEPILFSAAVSARLEHHGTSVARVALKGLDAPQEIFRP